MTFCKCKFNLILKALQNPRARNGSKGESNEIGQDFNNKAN